MSDLYVYLALFLSTGQTLSLESILHMHIMPFSLIICADRSCTK